MYKKYVKDGYIIGLGAGEEISREEYGRILAAINSRPAAPDGCYYALKENLEWELKDIPESLSADEEVMD